MPTQKLEALLKKQEQIKAQIQNEKNKKKEKTRKEDTRRKIIIGGYLISKAKEDMEFKSWLIKHLNKNLTKESDRELFKLPPLDRGEDNQG